MLKLTGIFLIFVSDFFIIKFILDGKIREIEFIKNVMTFLKNMSIEIIELKKPLYKAIVSNKGAISADIDYLIEDFEGGEGSPREDIILAVKNNCILDESTKKALSEYLNIAGRTTKEGMEDFLSVTINSLNYILNEKIEKNKNSKKTVNATVYSLSIVFVIFIL